MSDEQIHKPNSESPGRDSTINEVSVKSQNPESDSGNGPDNLESEFGEDNEDNEDSPKEFDVADGSREKSHEESDSFDASQCPQNVDGSIDYYQIYDDLRERFSQVYAVSQKLSLAERTQRQTLYHYKRRVNMLLDAIRDMEDEADDVADEPLKIDGSRLSSLLTWRPELEHCLRPALEIADSEGTDASQILVKPSYAVNLAVDEMIPEFANDELEAVELNPQDTEMWTRRNFLHMVVSKFRPVEIRAKGVREYEDPLSAAPKRKRRA